MADQLMYIPNNETKNYPFCRLNWWLKRLNTQLIKPTNPNSAKFPKVVNKTNKKTLQPIVRSLTESL